MIRVQYKIGDVYSVHEHEVTILRFSQNCAGYHSDDFQRGLCDNCPGKIVYTIDGVIKSMCGYSESRQRFECVKHNNVSIKTNTRW